MKKFNLAALPLAVAGILASTSALAGTEACFEVYRVDVGAPAGTPGVGATNGLVENHSALYTPASCIAEDDRAGASTTDLAATVNAKIAWELTGDLDVDLENLGAADPRHHIVYIPTSQLSASARVSMKITGADFGEDNANQIFLVLDNGTTFETVATSDGSFNNTSDITFIVGNDPIPAGSRLLLSSKSVTGGDNTDGTLIEGIHLHIANDETCTITPKVTIAATKALSDAGQVIAGAISSEAQEILNISEQFAIVANAQDTNEILVDAEDPSFRQQFVVSKVGGDWVGQVVAKDGTINPTAYWEAQFTNAYDTLDAAVDMDADDEITVMASATSGLGDGVTLSFLANIGQNGQVDIGNGTVLDAAEADHLAVGADDDIILLDIEEASAVDDLITLTETPTTYTIDANDIFRSDETSDIYAVARLMNADEEVMDFNYEVNTTWSMNFKDNDLLDKVGCQTPTPFEVGVNGAVLKVPYTYTKLDGGFVRITSEHTTEATIFMDIFDESSNETKNVNLGQIANKASNVFKTEDLLAAAVADGYVGTGARHTMTFTVTAPKNKVHGVSVQKIVGGVDRVMPVLDQNDWSQ